jgi:hypothetical protein
MDDFQRRALDIAQTSTYLTYAARQGQTISAIEYFVYNLNLTAIPASGTVAGTIQIQADSDFVCTYFAGAQIVPGTGVTNVPTGLIQLTDTGTGKTLFNIPAFGGLVLGLGGYPFLLPAPRTFAAQTSVGVTWQDLTAVDQTSLYFAMAGARIY